MVPQHDSWLDILRRSSPCPARNRRPRAQWERSVVCARKETSRAVARCRAQARVARYRAAARLGGRACAGGSGRLYGGWLTAPFQERSFLLGSPHHRPFRDAAFPVFTLFSSRTWKRALISGARRERKRFTRAPGAVYSS
jgi:hypothetical protein